MDGVNDFRVVDPLQIDRGDPEMSMPKLALDDDEGDAFVGHLDRVGVTELVVVPTSAQPPLCRPLGYAEACEIGLV